MKDPTFWILARSSGLLAFAALTASTLLGLLVKARPFRSLSRATVTDLHRFVATIALGSLAEHAPALIQIDGSGLAALRIGETDDEAILDAADACPMGAIAVFDAASGEQAA